MRNRNGVKPKLKARLDALKQVPARDPHAAARGRARFLAQAASILEAVSKQDAQRHIGWRLTFRKEKWIMNVAISIILTLALLFGGTATVAAAQDDLPNQPLYPLRIASEDMQLWFNNDAQQEIDLLMAFVQARIQEMAALAEMGITPPVQVAERMNLHIQLALQTAAGMDQSEMEGALLRIRTTLQEQEQIMTMLQLGATGETSQVVAQTRLMLENRIRQVDDGIADPQGFQSATRAEQEQRTGQTETPSTPQGNGPGPNPVETPPSSPGGHGNGSGGQGGNP